MPRYSLRTLIVVMLLGGPALAAVWFVATSETTSLFTGWAELVFFGLFAIAFGVVAAMLWLHALRVILAWPQATGEILRYWMKRSEGKPNGQRFYHPVVRFQTIDGRTMTSISSWGSWRHAWPLGARLTLRYCPSNPRWFEINCFTNLWLPPLLFSAGFLATTIAGWQYAEHLPFGERRFRHCVQCRVLEIQHSYCGWSWRTTRECEHTTWYRAHASPAHQHVWIGSTTPHTWQNWRGKTIAAGSNLDNGIATLLTPTEQTVVYERIDDVAEADAWFAQLRQLLKSQEREATVTMHLLKSWAADETSELGWAQWQTALENAHSN